MRAKSKLVDGKRVYEPHFFRWRSMMARCYQKSAPEFKRYGARGIYVVGEWSDFFVFQQWCFETQVDGRTIDRRDNAGPYSPSNCRWATPLEQQLNSRITPARLKGMKKAKTAQVAALHAKYGDPKTRSKKLCGTCGQVLPLSAFSKNRTTADGRQKICSPCFNRKYR